MRKMMWMNLVPMAPDEVPSVLTSIPAVNKLHQLPVQFMRRLKVIIWSLLIRLGPSHEIEWDEYEAPRKPSWWVNSIQITLTNGSSCMSTWSAKSTSKPVIGGPGENQEGQKISFKFSSPVFVCFCTVHQTGTDSAPRRAVRRNLASASRPGQRLPAYLEHLHKAPDGSAIKAILSNVWQTVLPEIQRGDCLRVQYGENTSQRLVNTVINAGVERRLDVTE